jgi:hypothetical protein
LKNKALSFVSLEVFPERMSEPKLDYCLNLMEYVNTHVHTHTLTLDSAEISDDISRGIKGSGIPEQSPIDLSSPGMLTAPGADIIPLLLPWEEPSDP